MTDRYELTMIEAALASGTANRKSVFEVFARRLPEGRRYGLVAGTGRFLEGLKDFRFTTEDLDYLANNNVVSETMLNWLADFRFSGTITGYAEGEIYFPNSPIIQVESTFAEAVILETYLSLIHISEPTRLSLVSRMPSSA